MQVYAGVDNLLTEPKGSAEAVGIGSILVAADITMVAFEARVGMLFDKCAQDQGWEGMEELMVTAVFMEKSRSRSGQLVHMDPDMDPMEQMDGAKGKKDKVFLAIGDVRSQEAYQTSRQSPKISKPPISTAPADSSTGRGSPADPPRSGALTQTGAASLSSLDDRKGSDYPLVPLVVNLKTWTGKTTGNDTLVIDTDSERAPLTTVSSLKEVKEAVTYALTNGGSLEGVEFKDLRKPLQHVLSKSSVARINDAAAFSRTLARLRKVHGVAQITMCVPIDPPTNDGGGRSDQRQGRTKGGRGAIGAKKLEQRMEKYGRQIEDEKLKTDVEGEATFLIL